MVKKGLSLDESLTPLEITCAKCGGKLIVFPYPIPTGTGYCDNCSPKWLKPFLLFQTNAIRREHGLHII